MKLLKLVVIAILTFIPFNSAFAASLKTIDNYVPMDVGFGEHWAFEQMDDLVNADIIEGFMDYNNNMYVKPEASITRAEFVKLIVSALDLRSTGSGKNFTDVKKGQWFYEPVQIASSLGIVNGKTVDKFAPNDNINRAEMTKIVIGAFKKTIDFPESNSTTFTDIQTSWAKDYIIKAAASELVNGSSNYIFNPSANAKRAEAMTIIHRALQKEQSNPKSEADITAFLSDFIQQENEYVKTNQLEQLIQLYEENGTGYFKVQGTMFSDLDSLLEVAEDFSVEIDDVNLTLDVLSSSNRFASVEVTGMTVTVKYNSEDFMFDYTLELDGVYKLKKDPDTGNWKIYSFYSYDKINL